MNDDTKIELKETASTTLNFKRSEREPLTERLIGQKVAELIKLQEWFDTHDIKVEMTPTDKGFKCRIDVDEDLLVKEEDAQ